ncbi:HAD family hydrolase [Riemerella columbina]|uniref:HAD family hydrolase n=1 Tax=Riemerella columbina TaxID=103810 RepID=UPI00266FC639|nr:HAD family hydrolase [Riemerella columbina]WKS96047.1 haloacid dehalogenase-like hydrolase [Riemerella columbina]
MKKLYLFDFDGTLTTKDTMFLYLKFYNPRKYWRCFVLHLPLFILLKMKLLSAQSVKESFIGAVLKGETKSQLEAKSQAFFEKYYPQIFRANALDFIANMDRAQTYAYIVTASLDIWVKPFAEALKMQLIATEAAFENDVFTGKFKTKNCNGEEKVVRIKQQVAHLKYDKSIAFGDTQGDQPMLQWANEGFYQFFHE